jgi:pentapeptide repeat protein
MREALSAFVLPHELQKRIALDNGRLLLDEKPTTWYQSAPGTAKSKLVISCPEPPCLITDVGFCILDTTAALGELPVGTAASDGASHGSEKRAVIPGGSVAGQDCAGGDFAYADLRGVQLAGCQLRGANFRGANLRGANLRGADARDTVFDLADLTAADCTEALLQGAHLRQARLHYTSLRQAFLLSAHLEHASLQGTDFTGANCEWAWVDGLDFQEAIVSCTLFLNARGLSALAQRTIEARGGFTGERPMILGRELYAGPLPGPTIPAVEARGGT